MGEKEVDKFVKVFEVEERDLNINGAGQSSRVSDAFFRPPSGGLKSGAKLLQPKRLPH